MTAGMMRIGKTLLAKLDFIGTVAKRSQVKQKRMDDLEFRRYYSVECGKNVDDIPEWRNTKFNGNESYTAFAKYAHDEPILDEEQRSAMALAASWMSDEFYAALNGSQMLSQETVIAGTDGRNSPGFPWNKWHRSCDEMYESDDLTLISEYWDRCKTASGAFTIWNSFLKEELRKQAKIEKGDIRQINGCAVEFKIAMNRFCLDMNERFYRSHLQTASCVGLVKYHGGWDRLYRKLAVHDLGFSLDVKRWDSHFPRVMLEIIKAFRWDCLDPSCRTGENLARYENLYEQIIKSATVMNWGEVFQTRLGNPSGSPNTVVDNTLGLYLLVAYCYIRSSRARALEPSYAEFCSHISLALYGDDNTFSGSSHGLDILNFSTMHQYAGELGFEVTDGGSPLPRPVIELDFLSSSFHRIAGGFIVSRPKTTHKALASMAFRYDGSPITSWARACSHRLNSFYDPEAFKIADGYCQWLIKILSRRAEAEGWYPEWQAARAQYKSERDLKWLYCSCE